MLLLLVVVDQDQNQDQQRVLMAQIVLLHSQQHIPHIVVVAADQDKHLMEPQVDPVVVVLD
tara:strand:+ start:206 stop:388 length:183 start_codon:yes stop_codon:yes gene_type:complete